MDSRDYAYCVCVGDSLRVKQFKDVEEWLAANCLPDGWIWRVQDGLCVVFCRREDATAFSLAWS